ncbi:arylamine N-acetyltransferase family protein [Polyangium jinanense]|uniref:Arylamine N-acetyltransferase n=1 Tax=Polyangium jinanense TaxID=2829994 RepID=A0A9X4AWJ8_9BACT|nr:arylamine N-acetyltransferase [Polyangium jinanense]MDC3960993.1 arylamine N-acetyltransferase [Polyangium jinanense]MDC3987413.1 arylamine N-acetyltransferase [Polyangium jinanense]
MTINLDAYLRRIGYMGPRAATLDALRELILRHTEAIPFENLNPLLGWPVPLDLPALEQKLVEGQRGGYCFEQNRLFQAALEALGFRVTALAARVLWNATEDAITPRSHMLLRVDLSDEPYIVDVGFGGQVLTGPLRLELGTEQPTPHEPFRLLPREDDLLMQSKIGDGWKTTYRFDLKPQYPVDFEVYNYYLSTHPRSHFRTGLMVARSVPGRRYTLRNRQWAVHHLGGPTERHTLEHAKDLRRTLERDFLLAVPDTPELEAAFERLT